MRVGGPRHPGARPRPHILIVGYRRHEETSSLRHDRGLPAARGRAMILAITMQLRRRKRDTCGAGFARQEARVTIQAESLSYASAPPRELHRYSLVDTSS